MNINNQVALCNELNMNFDEASELFCEESLQSMQMAKVNGGAWPGWILKLIQFAKDVSVILSAESIINAWNSTIGKTSPTPAESQINSTTVTKTTETEMTFSFIGIPIYVIGKKILKRLLQQYRQLLNIHINEERFGLSSL